jgi:transcriptional regulator GlxA family with amidase domain
VDKCSSAAKVKSFRLAAPLCNSVALDCSNPGADHSVLALALAERVGLSYVILHCCSKASRHYPATWVEQVRINAARKLLDGTLSPKQIASRCGFVGTHTLRWTFVRQTGFTPLDYRKRHTSARR